MTKAVLYARHSPRNDNECKSCEKQIEDLREWADKERWTVIGEHKDEGISGVLSKNEPPPALFDALAQLKKGYILAIRDVSRVCRDVFLQLYVEKRVRKSGANLKALNGNVGFDDPDKIFLYRILSAVAERERHYIRAITAAKMRKMMREGKCVGSAPPYGWKVEVRGGKSFWVPDEAEQHVIQVVMARHENGDPVSHITRDLKNSGVRTKNNAILRDEGVWRIIRRMESGNHPPLERLESYSTQK